MVASENNYEVYPAFWEYLTGVPVENYAAFFDHWFQLINHLEEGQYAGESRTNEVEVL